MFAKYLKYPIAFILFLLLFLSVNSFLSRADLRYFSVSDISSPVDVVDSYWVDSVFNQLTLRERVAQLFMLAVYSNKSEEYNKQTIDFIEKYKIGGVIFMQGGPLRQVQLSNRLQKASKVPLMVGIDGEWGVSMRLDSTIIYPRAMTIGAVQNDQLVFNLGKEIARQCRRLGVHVNFAPVIDVNSNPNNPIINSRSFGEDKINVARKGLAFAMGMQSEKVLAVGKHFPGHGDTKSDSHHTLPVINHEKSRLDTLELFPFKTLINNGLGGVMVAHMSMPNIISEENLPSSLSSEIVTDILKNELGFEGLIFTDALNMKGVTRDFKSGQIEIKALQAGSDILLFPEDIELAINEVYKAVELGIISEQLINARCKKVLKSKYWLGVPENQFVNTQHLLADLHLPKSFEIRDQIIENSITVVDEKNTFPLNGLNNKRIVSVVFGNGGQVFNEYLNYYAQVDTLRVLNDFTEAQFYALSDSLSSYDVVLLSQYQKSTSASRNYGFSQLEIDRAQSILQQKGAVLVLFANPYFLMNYTRLDADLPIVIAYENGMNYESIAAQCLFGGRSFSGKLPVSCNLIAVNSGKRFNSVSRLTYTQPYAFGLNDDAFTKVDSIANWAIEVGASPGCQILFAKEGRVIYNKSFGYHTYNKQRKVTNYNVYDIASITKIVASTVSLMKLYDEDYFDYKDKLSNHLSYLKNTDKKNMRIYEILAHQSGLHSWIPFFKSTLNSEGELRSDLYKNNQEANYSTKVLENLYLRNDFRDTLYQAIVDTPLYKKKKYRYSDLGYYWFADLIREYSGTPINKYAYDAFYAPLGMNRTTYNPLNTFSYAEIIPSENDQKYRKSVIHGFVNDQGAAMLGGVCGHAGVFSNANDLAKISQMLLNGGVYGEQSYLSKNAISVFNHSYFKRRGNRRALGFDKPALHEGEPGPACQAVSQNSFGHSGFTGTYLWIDPENESIYIFLSNRTFPDPDNRKLINNNIRTDIHKVFFDAFK